MPPPRRSPAMTTTRAPPVVELDLLGLRATAAAAADHGRRHATKSSSSSSSSSSIRGMETSAIARIGPQLLRRVIARTPPLAAAPPHSPEEAAAAAAAAAPMTLFYNGSVAVFDVTNDKAEAIMKIIALEASKAKGIGHSNINALVGNFAKDMPLARTKSLQQFFYKRKERLTSVSPYISRERGGTHGMLS
ncbi:hypothetical protein GUJ93_ZPchr0004g38268 [Zizania palustris]|uniref:Protein TIFY n=1 Tax=Zizania palustris TaxID=103762 RepID=A0A8J5SDW3_ZIZPA|nr:hypothetical protein GUJ93_ZPchr0004g38268 [Zizania palustris]